MDPLSIRIPGPPGRSVPDDLPGIGSKIIERIFCIDPALDSMSPDREVALVEGKGFTGCNRDLLLDEIDAGDKFGDGMLNLEPGIHLHEIVIPVAVQELDRSGIGIVRRLCHFEGRCRHPVPAVRGS